MEPSFITQLKALLAIAQIGATSQIYAGIASLNTLEALYPPAVTAYIANIDAALNYILNPANTKRFNPAFIRELQDVSATSTPSVAHIFELLRTDTPSSWQQAVNEINILIGKTSDCYNGLTQISMWGWAGPA